MMNTDTDRWRQQGSSGGFTLIEVLLVVAIIGMLATIGVLTLPGRQKQAMISGTRGKIANICTAIDVYEVDTGRFPASLQSLVNTDSSPNWQGPYLRGGLPTDAWGNEFQYSLKGETGYQLLSAGPDGSFGTGDDITSF